MSETKLPRWFLAVAVLALVWNAIGVMTYIQQVTMNPEAMAELPADEQALYESIPAWATGGNAVGVFAGLLGSVLLWMRRSMASLLFMVSLAGILVQMAHAFFMSDAMKVLGPTAIVLPAFVTVIAAALVWHSRRCAAQGWLR